MEMISLGHPLVAQVNANCILKRNQLLVFFYISHYDSDPYSRYLFKLVQVFKYKRLILGTREFKTL